MAAFGSDEARRPRHEPQNTGSALLIAALTRENLQRALKQVRKNEGAAGVDGLDIDQTAEHLRTAYGKLHLEVNETKSAVASVFGRKFVCFTFWVAPGGVVKRKVSAKAVVTFKQRIRQLTRRNGGRSLQDVVDRLRPYMLGWKGYFRLAQTPRVWRELDKWLRHRLRAIQLKQWKRGTTTYRELMALGAEAEMAQKAAGNTRRWWRNSVLYLNAVLTLEWSDRLGLPRLS